MEMHAALGEEAIMSTACRHRRPFLLLLALTIFTAPILAQLRVDRSGCELQVTQDPLLLRLRVESDRALPVQARVELLDVEDQLVSEVARSAELATGRNDLLFELPSADIDWSIRPSWLRVRYTLTPRTSDSPVDPLGGILPLSEISPDLFQITLYAPGAVRPGTELAFGLRTARPANHAAAEGIDIRVTLETEDAREIASLDLVTDSDGLASGQFNVPDSLELESVSLHARARRGSYQQDVVDRVQVRLEPHIFIQTDKKLYQPGQTVHIRALLFAGNRAVQGLPVTVEIGSSGHTAHQFKARTSHFGVAAGDWDIPADASLGRYHVLVRAAEGDREDAAFEIRRYDLPRFKVTAQADRPFYLPGDKAAIEVSAALLSGNPVPDARVRLIVEESRSWDAEHEDWSIDPAEGYTAQTDQDGSTRVEVDLSEAFRTHYLARTDTSYPRAALVYLSVFVTDPATGRTEADRLRLLLTSTPVHIRILAWELHEGLPCIFWLQTTEPDGSPLSATLELVLPGEMGAGVLRGSSNRYGFAKILGPPVPPLEDELLAVPVSITAHGAAGQQGRLDLEAYLDSRPAVFLEPERRILSQGEPIRLRISSSPHIEKVGIAVLGRRGWLSNRIVRLTKQAASLEIPYRDDFEGLVTMRAFSVADSKGLGDARVVYPQPARLTVQVLADRAEYRPGDEAAIDFRIDTHDLPSEAILGVTVVDEGVSLRQKADDRQYASASRSGGSGQKVSLSTLLELDTQTRPGPELELAAEALLESWGWYDSFHAADSQAAMFGARSGFSEWLKHQREGVLLDKLLSDACKEPGRSFPQNEAALRNSLGRVGFSLETLRDPWGQPYYARFEEYDRPTILVRFGNPPGEERSLAKEVGHHVIVRLFSKGLDGLEETDDDFELTGCDGLVSTTLYGDLPPLPAVSGDLFGSGSVSGRILDPTLAPIPGVDVTVRIVGTDRRITAHANEEGRFQVGDLPIGRVDFVVSLEGFRTATLSDVPVYHSADTEVEIILKLGETSESCTVTGRGLLIQTETSGTGPPENEADTLRLRSYFPETLVWQPALEAGPDGRAQLRFRMADNITNWQIRAVASTVDGRLAFAHGSIRSFQPFFLELDPPSLLTQGDRVAVPVTVRNYTGLTQSIDLAAQGTEALRLLGRPGRRLTLDPNGSQSESFWFSAERTRSEASIRIDARGADISDAVRKHLEVQPDGRPSGQSTSRWSSAAGRLELDLPARRIEGETTSELRIYLDPLAQVLDAADGLLRRPFGCAEQVASVAYSNLLLLRALALRPGHDPEIEARARRNLETNALRLMAFQTRSGGFSFWRYGEPSLQLTGYVLEVLLDLRDSVTIDDWTLLRAAAWMVSQQTKDGSWSDGWSDCTPQVYRVISRLLSLPDVDRSGVLRKRAEPVLERGFGRLHESAAQNQSPASLTLLASAAFASGDRSLGLSLAERLRQCAVQKGDWVYWEPGDRLPFGSWGRAARIELTARVLVVLLQNSALSDPPLLPDDVLRGALLFLVENRDQFRVWWSTQATVRVLEALLAARERLHLDQPSLAPTRVLLNGQELPAEDLGSADRQGILTAPIPASVLKDGSNALEMEFPGAGGALAQWTADYFVPWTREELDTRTVSNEDLTFTVRYEPTRLRLGDSVRCRVRIGRSEKSWGMLIVEIGLPPGAEVDRASLDAQKAVYRYEVAPDRVTAYVWPLAGEYGFEFTFRPRYPERAVAPASRLFDYYNPEASLILAPVAFQVE